jgi:hypothetical protein
LLNKSDEQLLNLPALANFLKEMTNTTGAYIGWLRPPIKPIEEDDDDKAHIDEENPKYIWFNTHDPSHSFMFEKVLKIDQGVTHDVFKDKEENASQPPPEEEGEEGYEIKKSEDILDLEQHVYVPEVVREPRMHFYLVPRLGCYLAAPLSYHSCLTEEALDAAVADYQEVVKA